jgi:hypothetical protein
MKKIIISLIFILSFCEIKKNQQSPNGPFGILTLYYNLSKVGDYFYNPSNILYISTNSSIPENMLLPKEKSSLEIVFDYSLETTLPDGLKFNTATGSLYGSTSEEKAFSEYKIFRNNFFFKNKYATTLSIQFKDFQILGGINTEIYFTPPFESSLNSQNYTYTNFSITPSLPSGFSLDKNTGIIIGNSANTYNQTHLLTATRSDGKIVSAIFSIYIYEYYQEAYIKASNSRANDQFGSSVSVHGDTLVVGARLEDSSQTTITNGTTSITDFNSADSGAVYVYKRTGSIWSQEAYIKAVNSEAGDNFGISVSNSGDTIAIASLNEDSNQTTITNDTFASTDNSKSNSGAVYVYKRNGDKWSQEAYIKTVNSDSSDRLGNNDNGSYQTISIEKDTLAISSINEGSNQTTITNGTTASSNNSLSFAGAVYVYKRTNSSWQQEAYLKASNTGDSDLFGCSVSISGDTIAVGARNEDSNYTTVVNGTSFVTNDSTSNSGAVYVFKRTGTNWSQEAYLKASNASSSYEFGVSVSISGDRILVGSRGEASSQTTISNGTTASSDNSSTLSGAAYVFKRTGSTWQQEAYLKAPNSGASDRFGFSTSLHDNYIVIGAPDEQSSVTTISHSVPLPDNNTMTRAGAAYIYKWNGTKWIFEARLKASNADLSTSVNGNKLGTSVSIYSDTIVVGAIGEQSNQTTITNGTTSSSNNSIPDSGAVYVFRRKK